MKTRFTPGPWEVLDLNELITVKPGDPPFGIWSEQDNRDDSRGTRIAEIKTNDPDITTEQIKGNALLIGQAPCLHSIAYALSQADLADKDILQNLKDRAKVICSYINSAARRLDEEWL